MFAIQDRPGCISVSHMRHYFEGGMRQTDVLQKRVALDCRTDGGEFLEYADPATQAMWVGFALGMRCAERLQNAVKGEPV